MEPLDNKKGVTMKKYLFKEIPTWITVICLSTSAFAFSIFGTGTGEEVLIPFLQQQIIALKSSLRTANETLGYIKGAQRGFSRIRHYGMNDAKNDFIFGNPDYLGIKQELYTAKEGGDYTDIRIGDLDRKIRSIYKPKSERTVPEARRSLFASNIAHKNMKTSMIMRDKTSRQTFSDGRAISNASKNSLSPAESQRITADGVGLIVQSQADQMVLLSNINQNSAAGLQIDANQEKSQIEAKAIDSQSIKEIKNSMRPVR